MSSITLGVLRSAGSVDVQIAEDKGFFKQQGLDNVKIVDMATTNQATTGLLSHTMDFAAENYVGMYTQDMAANLNLKVVADDTQSPANNLVLMVPKDSKLTSIAQLKGKKVGLPAPGFNFGAMALDILLKPYHESSSSFTTVILPFSAATQALAKHEVDAIFTLEPFITISEAAGDRIFADLASGPLANLPSGCYGTTASFTQKYPKTVAAFQRAMQEATQVAATNPSYVRSELPKYIPTMKPALANIITLPQWNTTLSLTRLERVANILQQTGGLPKSVNANALAKSLYYPLAGSAS
jgi:NitT/TauT family transport system substrate-binding protein